MLHPSDKNIITVSWVSVIRVVILSQVLPTQPIKPFEISPTTQHMASIPRSSKEPEQPSEVPPTQPMASTPRTSRKEPEKPFDVPPTKPMAGTPRTSKKEPERPSEVLPTLPMASTPRTSKKEPKPRQLPKKIRDLPYARICFNTFKVDNLEKPEITPEDIPMSSQDEDSPVDDSVNHPTTPPQSQGGSSSDEVTEEEEDFDIAAAQFHADHLPTPGLQGNHIMSQRQPILEEQTSIPRYPLVPDLEYQFGVQLESPQYPVVMSPYPTFCPQHNTFNCVVHAANIYAAHAQRNDYAAYSTHHLGPWTGPSQAGSNSGTG